MPAGAKMNSSGEAVAGVLPLYITLDHFKRSVHYTHSVLRHLTCKNYPNADEWLDVIPRILNTLVVLICDKVSLAAIHMFA